MAAWSWRTLADERVEVDKGGGFAVPTLDTSLPVVEGYVERVLSWLPEAEKYGAKHGVPPSWILGFMYAESQGNPNAENPCCVGLLAIYYSVHGKTREQMLDPDQNLDYGASIIGQSRAKGYELPEAASIHVAGGGVTNTPHTNSASPWGMAEHMWPEGARGDGSQGYIDQVVRANNVMVERIAALQGRRPPAASSQARVSGPVTLVLATVALVGGFFAAQRIGDYWR